MVWRRARTVTLGNALCNLVVPLLLGSPVQKADNDHGHVVTSNTASLTTRCQAVVHHVLADVMKILPRGNTPPDELNHGLRRLDIPDTYMMKNGGLEVCNRNVEGDDIHRELDIPSQAITKNSSSSQSSWTVTSGYAVTICCSGDNSALLLNSKSPRARDKARLPLTRPKSTKPPAALIRAFSPIFQITQIRIRN